MDINRFPLVVFLEKSFRVPKKITNTLYSLVFVHFFEQVTIFE